MQSLYSSIISMCKNSATAFSAELQSRSSSWGSWQFYVKSYSAWHIAEPLLYSLMLCRVLLPWGKCEGICLKSMCVIKPFPLLVLQSHFLNLDAYEWKLSALCAELKCTLFNQPSQELATSTKTEPKQPGICLFRHFGYDVLFGLSGMWSPQAEFWN